MKITVYDSARRVLRRGEWQPANDELYAMLLTGGYRFDAKHATTKDVKASESTGKGYVAGGKKLATSLEEGTDNDVLLAESVEWPAATIRARYLVVYHKASGALLACGDMDEEYASANAAFTVDVRDKTLMVLGTAKA